MLRAHTGLELNRDFLILRMGFRTARYRWREIEGFHLIGAGPLTAVSFNISNPALRQRLFQVLHRFQTGYDDGIPNVFQLPLTELFELLTDWHSRLGFDQRS